MKKTYDFTERLGAYRNSDTWLCAIGTRNWFDIPAKTKEITLTVTTVKPAGNDYYTLACRCGQWQFTDCWDWDTSPWTVRVDERLCYDFPRNKRLYVWCHCE